MHIQLKEQAIALRKQGYTYSEILETIQVAKSTLSLWLREVGLATKQFQRLTEKKLLSSKRGAQARKQQRIQKQQEIYALSDTEIDSISERELWLIGIALYWAEGNKEKEYHPGSNISFSNSDPRMISVFIKWLIRCLSVSIEEITVEIYIHENMNKNLDQIRSFWADVTKFPIENFMKVYYKKHNPKTKRKNVGDLYYGLLRVKVCGSSHLLRRVDGWTKALYKRI